ncbi:MAG: hypothetical protein PHU58_02185 [Prevotella sp.]|nr:hypothetical protein [Prevotella sp.]
MFYALTFKVLAIGIQLHRDKYPLALRLVPKRVAIDAESRYD